MLRVFNTLTRQKEQFVPIKDKCVNMYSCGPTVYSYAHIGNLRTYIFMDLLRRTLRYDGFKLKGVLNITDVGHLMADSDDGEDKMVKASREAKKSPWELAEMYSKVFFEDLAKLNIGKPEIIAKATDHIEDMITFVKDLIDAGYAYETSDGIYYDISKFKGYGALSGIDLEGQEAGKRVEVNEEKRNPADFAVWKKAEPLHIMQWKSPWGMGYPGWHIECSAMSKKYLGNLFDIHTGGVDHIPIHHENEIAQNEALTGKKSVNFWLHGEFMLVDGGKMSKSLGNTYTIAQLEERGFSALDFRFFCLNAHYRQKLNFTWDGMKGAKTARGRLCDALLRHKVAKGATDNKVIEKFMTEFREAIDDDLNVPLALGVLFTAVKEPSCPAIFALALEMDKVLGLSLDKVCAPAEVATPAVDVPEAVRKLCEERILAKKAKDFARADELRKEIAKAGYAVADTKDGYTVTKG